MNLDLIKELILGGASIKPLTYYSYPTGTVGSSYIANEDVQAESPVVKVVESVLDNAVSSLGLRRDNKEAVKCQVEGVDDPVYFVSYDSKRVICLKIDTTRGGTEYQIT